MTFTLRNRKSIIVTGRKQYVTNMGRMPMKLTIEIEPVVVTTLIKGAGMATAFLALSMLS